MSEPKILVSRLSAVGDCILTMPVLCALRDKFPNARLVWVVEKPSAALLRGHSCLDELVVVPRGWLKSPSELFRVRRELRALGIETAIDAQSLSRSAVAAWLSGARQRIGHAAPRGRELAPWLANHRVKTQRSHIVDAQLELLGPLEAQPSQPRFDVPECPRARDKMSLVLTHPDLSDGYAVVNPGAGWDSKIWPADRLTKVATYLGEKRNLPSLVVWAGDREREMAEEIVEAADGHARLAPRTSLPELAVLVRDAQLFVGSDTGPMHLAAACGTRCVSVYGPTMPSRCGPYGSGHIVLQAYYQGGKNRRKAANDAMRAVSAQQVIGAIAAVDFGDGKGTSHSEAAA